MSGPALPTPAAARYGQPNPRRKTMKTATAPTGAVVITREGRGRLTQRLHDLDETVLPQLREQLWTKDRDRNDDAALAAALAERHSITAALTVSVDAEAI